MSEICEGYQQKEAWLEGEGVFNVTLCRSQRMRGDAYCQKWVKSWPKSCSKPKHLVLAPTPTEATAHCCLADLHDGMDKHVYLKCRHKSRTRCARQELSSWPPSSRQQQAVRLFQHSSPPVHILQTNLFLMFFMFLLLPHGLIGQSFDMPPTGFFDQPVGGQPEQLGNDKVLVCYADGVPPPVYRWKKDGRFMTDNNVTSTSMKLEDMDRADAGEYQCVASNEQGALLSSRAFVHVAYMVPFANTPSQEKTVDQGYARIIDMPPIDSYPEPKFQWKEGDAFIHKESLRHHITLQHQLVILETRLRSDNNKRFKARANNAYTSQSSESQEFLLRVLDVGSSSSDIPPQIVIPPSHTSVVKNTDSVVMECVANARPINYLSITWYRRLGNNLREPLDDEDKYLKSIYSRRLTILSPTLEDTGTYECEATFSKPGGVNYSPVSAQANLTVYDSPKFSMLQKQEITGDVGTTVSLPCKARGTPSPTHIWHRNAEEIDLSVNNRMSLQEDGSLQIDSVQTQDSGVFQCFISNAAGEMYTATWLRVLSSPPQIIQKPANWSVIADDDVTFTCEVDGAPKPTISWYRVTAAGFEDLPRSDGHVQLVGIGSSELLIPVTKPSDTGKYVCNATNTLGSKAAEAYLTVTLKTRIVQPPQDKSIVKGLMGDFSCGVSHDPSIEVTWVWYHEDNVISNSDPRRQIMENGNLQISQVRNGDIGTYRCQVTSLGGNATAEANLKVIELPYAPSMNGVALSAERDRDVDISWIPGFDGGTPITKFVVMKRLVPDDPDVELQDDDDWSVVDTQVPPTAEEYTVQDLLPAKTYQFRVSAVNSVGEGLPSEPSNSIKLPQQPPSGPPRGVVGSARSESSIMMQWQPPEGKHWNGDLLGYMVKYKLSGYSDDTVQYKNRSSLATNNYELANLIVFQVYEIAVAAYNAKGVGVYSDYISVRTQEGVPSAAPTGIAVEAVSSTVVAVEWMPPHSQQLNGINQGYKVEAVVLNSSDEPLILTILSDPANMLGQQSGSLTDLKKFTSYSITVLCFTSKGDGPKSEPIQVKTLEDVPGPVGSLTFDNILDTSLQVIWTPPTDINGVLVGYTLTYMKKNDTLSLMSIDLSGSVQDYTVTDLEATTTYTIEVYASTRVGSGPVVSADISSGIPPELPGPPTRLALSNIGETSVSLQFVPGFDGHTSISKWIVEAQTRQEPDDEGTAWSPLYETPDSEPTSHGLVIMVYNLYPYTHYRLRLMAENIAGQSARSEPSSWFQTIQAAPTSAPEEVTVRAINETALRVRWTPLASQLWHGEGKGYSIRYRVSGLMAIQGQIAVPNENTNSYELTDLQEWTRYEVQVAAFNQIGLGPYSQLAVDTTRESVPSTGPANVTVNALSSTSIEVNWHPVPELDRNGLVLGYKARYWSAQERLEPVVRNIESANVMATELIGLRKYITYEVQVLAYTRIGDGAYSEPPVSVRTFEDVPGPPSSIYFPEVTHSTALLVWSPPREPNGIITGYRVEYKEKTEPPSAYSIADDSLGAERRDFRVEDLQRTRFYIFTVTAKTQLGWGEPADVEVYTILDRRVPEAPGKPGIGPSQVDAHWATITWQPGDNGYAPIRNYTIQMQKEEEPFLDLDEYVPHNVNFFTISDLNPNTKYRFRITAYNDVGRSPYSEASAQIITSEAAPDSPPLDLRVVPQTTTAVLVSWKPPPDSSWNGERVGYQIWYAPLQYVLTGTEANYQQQTVMFTHTRILLSNLASQQDYEVKVAALGMAGLGPFTQPYDIYVGEAVPTAPPQDVIAEMDGSTRLQVTWLPPPEENQNGDLLGYKIFYWETDSSPRQELMKSVQGSETRATLDQLRMYTRYSLLILAFNTAGDGPNISLPITQRTDEGLPGAPLNLDFFVTSLTSLNVTWEAPQKPNGKLLAYEVSFSQQMSADGESRNVQVTLSGSRHNYEVRELTENVSYMFSVRARTKVGWGPAVEGNVTIGPQPGSPDSPERPWIDLGDSKSSFVIRWENRDAGASPIVGYIIQSREKETNQWQTLMRTKNHNPSAVVSYQNLKHRTEYQFRVIATNSHGISYPSLPTSTMRSLSLAEEDEEKFYQQWWFLVIVALTGLIFIILVVSVLCITGRRRAAKYKENTIPRTTVQPSMNGGATIIEDAGFNTYELRRSQRGPSQRRASYRNSLPAAAAAKNPPRPSPGSVNYSDDESKYADDSSSLSEKPSELSLSDNESQDSNADSDVKLPLPPPPLPMAGPSSFNHTYVNGNVHNSWKQNNSPHNPYNAAYAYTDSEQESSTYGVGLNGGHVIMNNMAGSRAPLPGFSSFV